MALILAEPSSCPPVSSISSFFCASASVSSASRLVRSLVPSYASCDHQRKHHGFDAVSRILSHRTGDRDYDIAHEAKGWHAIWRHVTCGALKQSEMHALAQCCRAVTDFRTSRSWVLRYIPMPCIKILLLP
eukprot:319615-Pyramimonas_sp.AAC.2